MSSHSLLPSPPLTTVQTPLRPTRHAGSASASRDRLASRRTARGTVCAARGTVFTARGTVFTARGIVCAARGVVCIALLAVSAGGCKSSDGFTSGRPIEPDADLIKEADAPRVNFDTFFAAGELAESRGRWRDAAFSYSNALDIEPDNLPTLRRLAIAQVRCGDLPVGLASWQTYLAQSDGAPDAYGGLGYCYELCGDLAKADQTYRDGLARHPDGQLLRVNYGLMLARSGKIDQAKTNLAAVLTAGQVEYNLASVFEQQGKLGEAQQHYKLASQLDPTLAAAHQRLAAIE